MPDAREVLEDLGPLDLDLEEGDIVTDALVLIRVQRLEDTDDSIVVGTTENTGGIVGYGMIMAAKLQIETWMLEGPEKGVD